MKTAINFLLVVVFFTLNQTAQAQVNVGLRIGAEAATVVVSDDTEDIIPDGVGGTDVALMLEYELSKPFSVQAELGYSVNGFALNFGDEESSLSLRTKIQSFDLPLLTKFGLNLGPIELFATLGPVFRYATSGKFEAEAIEGSEVELESMDIDFAEEEMKRTDVGLNIGTGLGININKVRLFLDMRYIQGLTNVNADATSTVSTRNASFGGNFGVLINIK